jgi:hypothetical protein
MLHSQVCADVFRWLHGAAEEKEEEEEGGGRKERGRRRRANGHTDSIKNASSNIAKELFSYYAKKDEKGWTVLGGYPGVLYEPYYWWLCGAMFGTLLDYWRYTGDSQYNDLIREGMIHQMGDQFDLVSA